MADEQQPIYLDHNATTPVHEEVLEAMLPYLRQHFGNPSSDHAFGAPAKRAIARAREQVASLLCCDADEILFTSGGTEANNLAITGSLAARAAGSIVTSAIEHPATAKPCAWHEARGLEVRRLGVDAQGRVRLEEASRAIDERVALVTVMHANNETGVLQPIARLAEMAHRAGALVHSDAAQSVGKIPVHVDALGVDLLSLAGHKLYAPKGIGALYLRRGTALEPFTLGAGHERGLRPGTENVASIVALGQACALAERDLDEQVAATRRRRDMLWTLLSDAIEGLVLHGHLGERLPNTLHVRFPGVLGADILASAPEIAASTGSACHAGQHQASAVIVAMGLSAEEALGSVRLTLGRQTRDNEIVRAASALVRAWREVGRSG